MESKEKKVKGIDTQFPKEEEKKPESNIEEIFGLNKKNNSINIETTVSAWGKKK